VAIELLITPDSIESGSLRAVDAALVVHQLALALGPEVVSTIATTVSGPRISRPIGGF
jgi:hypothetical protein